MSAPRNETGTVQTIRTTSPARRIFIDRTFALQRQSKQPPVVELLGAETFVEANRRGVPIERGPFHAGTISPTGQLNQVLHDPAADAATAGRRADVHVFEVQAGATGKGRKIV